MIVNSISNLVEVDYRFIIIITVAIITRENFTTCLAAEGWEIIRMKVMFIETLVGIMFIKD